MSEQLDSSPLHIEWATAEVRDGVLTVAVAGERPRGWAPRLRAVLALLTPPNRGWADIDVARAHITVADVREGAESDLRHHLDSALLQVSADLSETDGQGANDDESTFDGRMQQAFRSFADSGV